MTKAEVLDLLKADLGITITKRDAYFASLLDAAAGELKRKGIVINYAESGVDDIFLLVDYTAWTYRKRNEGTPLPENLKLRIRNRILKNRAKGDKNE